MALLDGTGRIRLVNGAMEHTLGWRRYDLEGRAWVDSCVPPELVVGTQRCLDEALRGMLRRHDAEIVTRDARRLLVRLDMSLVGRGEQQGLLLAVESATEVRTGAAPQARKDFEYQITIDPSAFGVVKNISYLGCHTTIEGSLRCFEMFHQRQVPCEDCPALGTARDPWPRTVVRRRYDPVGGFEIITAAPTNPTELHVSVRIIAEQTLSAIQEAKIRALSDAAGLSERERSVLTYLLMGRSLDDIATILDLSRSTVKFHQGNILQKLGADSRVDLIRLTGF